MDHRRQNQEEKRKNGHAEAAAPTAAAPTPSSSWTNELISGAVAGSVGVVVGHPFDTLKVRLQTSASTSTSGTTTGGGGGGAAAAAVSAGSASPRSFSPSSSPSSSSPSLRSLYRGIGPPFLTAGFVNAIIFTSFNTAGRLYDEHEHGHGHGHERHNNNNDNNTNSSTNRSTSSNDNRSMIRRPIVCGCFAGVTSSLLLAPMELIKCRLQQQQQPQTQQMQMQMQDQQKHKSQWTTMVHHVVRRDGLMGLYRGFVATLCRQVPGFAIYFSTYHYLTTANKILVEEEEECDGVAPSSSSSWVPSPLVAGGIAGSVSWFCVYPIDVIKSRIQCYDGGSAVPRIRDVFKSIMLAGSSSYQSKSSSATIPSAAISQFYRGVGVTILRAFPVNGVIFLVYERVHQRLVAGVPAGGAVAVVVQEGENTTNSSSPSSSAAATTTSGTKPTKRAITSTTSTTTTNTAVRRMDTVFT